MPKDYGKRFAGFRKRTLVMAAMAFIMPLTAVVSLASASTAAAEPMGIFKIFKECPLEYIPDGLEVCSYNKTTSGEFQIGTTKVPISPETIIQQGGLIPTGNPSNPAEYFAVPAKNGESLSKTELEVPGGLTDIINCKEIKGEFPIEKALREACKAFFEGTALGVTATAELVANEKNPVLVNEFALSREEGTGITLPLRVHLKNPFLGNSCYIGSEAHPVELHLTTGATSLKEPPKGWKSIHGKFGETSTPEEKGHALLRVTGNSLVDNTYPAPAPEGCGEFTFFGFKYTGLLDFLVESKLKIPNKAGENSATLNGELNSTGPAEVIASESF